MITQTSPGSRARVLVRRWASAAAVVVVSTGLLGGIGHAAPTPTPTPSPSTSSAPPTPTPSTPGTPSTSPTPTPTPSPSSTGGWKQCAKNLPKCAAKQHKEQAGKMLTAPGDLAAGGANLMLTSMAEGVSKLVTDMMKLVVTGWLNVPSIKINNSGIVTSNEGDEHNSAIGTTASYKVQAIMFGLGALVAILLLMVQGLRTAFSRRGEPLLSAFRGLFIMAVIMSCGLLLLNSLLIASDAVTNAILSGAVGSGLEKRVMAMFSLSTATLGPVPVILFGLFVFTIALIQMIMVFIRQAAIPVLAMLMPVAAAGQVGGNISQKWLIQLWTSLFAIVLYKPLAALIFAVGFMEIGEGKGFWDIIRGLTTLFLACLALPVLMRIFQPIVGTAVSIGAHNFGFGTAIGGLSSLTGGGGDGGGKDGGKDGGPASPAAYEKIGGQGGADAAGAGAVGAGPAAAMAVAQKVGDTADAAVQKGAEAFVGEDGGSQPSSPTSPTGGGGSGGGGEGGDGGKPPVPPPAEPPPTEQGDPKVAPYTPDPADPRDPRNQQRT